MLRHEADPPLHAAYDTSTLVGERRYIGVTAATLSRWRDAFLAAGEAVLATKSATGEELESDRLKAKLGTALIERDLLIEKIAVLEANRPLGRRMFKP